MEIVGKLKPSCRFDEIDEGDCFINGESMDAVYMRVRVINTEYTHTAVDLTTGQIYAFSPDSIVKPVDARVEIG